MMAVQQKKRGVSVSFKDEVAVLRMSRGENRVNSEFLQEINNALDEVEGNPDIKALVTIGEDKFYSNGLDLSWIAESNDKTLQTFRNECHVTFERLQVFPVITIAALNGHTYAAGALLAMLHDFRVMRKDRGWFCLPEINLNMRFEGPMIEILRDKLPIGNLRRDAILLGRKYTGEEALRAGIVDSVAENSVLLETSIQVAKDCLAKNGQDYSRTMMTAMKSDLYQNSVEALHKKQPSKL